MKSHFEEIASQFHDICLEISKKEDEFSKDIEDSYSKLLNLACVTGKTPFLVNQFLEAVLNFRHARNEGYLPSLSIDAIAYCMHELRWTEIYNAAVDEHKNYFAKRKETTLVRLIDSFKDDWDEVQDYRRWVKH